MALIELERGDVILARDGREIRVEKIRRPSGVVTMIEGIDCSDPSPMMTPIFSKDIIRILRKSNRPKVKEEDKLPPEMKTNVPKDVKTLEKVKEEVATRDLNKVTSAENAKQGGKR